MQAITTAKVAAATDFHFCSDFECVMKEAWHQWLLGSIADKLPLIVLVHRMIGSERLLVYHKSTPK